MDGRDPGFGADLESATRPLEQYMNCFGAKSKWSALIIGCLFVSVSCTSHRSSSVHVPTKPAEIEQWEAQSEGLAQMKLPVPNTAEFRSYLGIEEGETFAIGDIKTRILLVEVFSMYCPHCQREAPRVNDLYRQIADNHELRDQIKIIGIGVGNTSYEVDIFRKTYAIPFPLFPDRSMERARQLGAERTPTFIGFVYENGGAIRQFIFQTGGFSNTDAFLNEVIGRSGLPLVSSQ